MSHETQATGVTLTSNPESLGHFGTQHCVEGS